MHLQRPLCPGEPLLEGKIGQRDRASVVQIDSLGGQPAEKISKSMCNYH